MVATTHGTIHGIALIIMDGIRHGVLDLDMLAGTILGILHGVIADGTILGTTLAMVMAMVATTDTDMDTGTVVMVAMVAITEADTVMVLPTDITQDLAVADRAEVHLAIGQDLAALA